MYTPNKIIKYVKNSISNIFSDISVEESIDSITNESMKWSANSDTLMVNKMDYEALKNDHFNQTEIIKRLTRRNEENISLIHDYENTFSMVLQKDLVSTRVLNKQSIPYSHRKMEDEIERLKCTEQRMKSHIQALKKELIVEETKNKAALEDFKDEILLLRAEKDDLLAKIKIFAKKIEELEFKNKDSQIEIEIKCKELAEAIEYARMLMKQ